MAEHGGHLFFTIYMYKVDDEKPLTAMIPRDHQSQRVFGRGVRPRVDNSDHRGQRVY